jgi:hypothetical protein
MDLVGVEALERPEEWDMAAFMRYRSRRTFMEIDMLRERGPTPDAFTLRYPFEAPVSSGA